VNTWKVILATMVIFGAGVVTGSLGIRQSQQALAPRPAPGNQPRNMSPVSPGGLRIEFLRRAQRDLDLAPQQRERIDKLLKQSQERSREIMKPVAAELRTELERTTEQFKQELTPKQRTRFEELLKKQQRPHESRRPTLLHPTSAPPARLEQ